MAPRSPVKLRGAPAVAAEGANTTVEQQLTAVEISYVDPKSGNICRREAFCDPVDWGRLQSRFLISSDLVNLLSEAVLSRRARFKQRHDHLAQLRFGFTCDLWRLRNSIDHLSSKADEYEDANEKEHTANLEEACPIHYYRPDLYFDSWTHERLEIAIQNWKKRLEKDLLEARDMIHELGGTGWFDLLQRLLKGGAAPHYLAGRLLDLAQPPELREIENKLSGGLTDKVDAVRPLVEALEPEYEDYTDRRESVEAEIRENSSTINELEIGLSEVSKKLQEPAPVLPPDSESEPESEDEGPDDSAARAKAAEIYKAVLEDWSRKLKLAREETERLKETVAELEAKWKARGVDEVVIHKLEDECIQFDKSADRLRQRVDKLGQRDRAIKARVTVLEAETTQEQIVVEDLRTKLAALPPPPPKSMLYANLMQELKRLAAEAQALLKSMKLPASKVKAIRYQLKALYQKLGWDWEFSDSEDEEDKPYWQRRKLATGGLAKFDANAFIYTESSFQRRRLKQTVKRESAKTETALLSRMVANRHLHSEHIANLSRTMDSTSGPEEQLGPFKTDDGDLWAQSVDSFERPMRSTSRHLSSNMDEASRTLSPRPSRETAEMQALCGQLLRIHQQRSSCLEQLRHCAKCLADTLPGEGPLAGQKARVECLAANLSIRATELDLLGEQDEVERDVVETCGCLQDAVEEAIRVSDKVGPIAAAVQHASTFAGLRQRMVALCADARQVRGELRAVAGPDLLAASSTTRLPSMRSSGSFGELSGSVRATGSSAGQGSPRPRPPPSPAKGGALGAAPGRPPPPHRPGLDPLVEPICAGCGPSGLLGTADGGHNRRRHGKADGPGSVGRSQEAVDFGFRPDGVGEEPLENWSLFKVSKEAAAAGGPGGRGPVGDRLRSMDPKAARLEQRMPHSSDFREYVSQTKQSSKEMWQSASAPDLQQLPGGQWKRGPSLPQLVKPEASAQAQAATNSLRALLDGGMPDRRRSARAEREGGRPASPRPAEARAGGQSPPSDARRKGKAKSTALPFRNAGW